MDFGQQYLAVAAVLALLGGGLWWLRRHGYAVRAVRGRGGRSLESLERLALSPQHTLHLVRAGRAVVLLACSPQGCQILRELGPDSAGETS
jgi:flagellar biogenesis protein FliO